MLCTPPLNELLKELKTSSNITFAKGVLYLVCSCFEDQATFIKKGNLKDELLLNNILNFVTDNYNHNCSLSDLEKETSYNYVYLSKYFKQTCGISFNSYVNQYRIDEACRLLVNTADNILEISTACGYTSLRSFNRNFKQYTGLTPNEYRAKFSPDPPRFRNQKVKHLQPHSNNYQSLNNK